MTFEALEHNRWVLEAKFAKVTAVDHLCQNDVQKKSVRSIDFSVVVVAFFFLLVMCDIYVAICYYLGCDEDVVSRSKTIQEKIDVL